MRQSFGCWRRRCSTAVFLWLAACSSAPQPVSQPPPAQPNPPAFAQCQAALGEANAVFEVLQPQRSKEGCGYDEAVRLSAGPVPFNRAAVLACPMALAFTRFVEEVLQPAARRHFGEP